MSGTGILFQEWTTVGTDTGAGVYEIPQPASAWLDLGFASDLLFILEVSQFSTTESPVTSYPAIHFEAAPLRDESLFRTMISNDALTPASAPYITRVSLCENPLVPVFRWVRWRATKTPPGIWSLTFRILLMAYER